MILSTRPDVEILMVCSANICRSPMAEGLLRAELKGRNLYKKVLIDSAGTHASQPGHPVDGRARRVCAREGIDLGRTRARQVTEEDFVRFDYILAMDERNLQWLSQACPDASPGRISLFGQWATAGNLGNIPDPYYGSLPGFERVLQMLRQCVEGFLAHLVDELQHGARFDGGS